MKQKKQPILSISLLSCGTEPHIEDCLNGIAPLREKLGAEIIVVDTSAEKEGDVRSIIEKYADEVVDFDWCDDFAAARNAGLKRCHGEWFMFVDDDEVFQSVDPIIDFFESGEYRDYHTASIVIRNLGDDGGNEFYDNWVPRMHVRPKGAHFEGRVHERYTPAEYPLKALTAIVDHYGYIFNTKDEFEEHIGRNLRLIKAELAEHPDDVVMRVQLLQEYGRKRDFDRQKEIALDILSRLKGKRSRQASIYRGICQGLILRADRMQERYGEAEERLLALKKRKSYLPVAKAYFAQEGARLYDIMAGKGAEPEAEGSDAAKYLELSRKEAEEYLSVYDGIKDELDKHADELAFYLASTFDDENLGDMRGIMEGKRPPERKGVRILLTDEDPAFILALPFEDWKEKTDRFMDSATAAEIAKRHDALKAKQDREDIRYDYYYMRTDEKMLMAWVKDYDGILPEELPDIENAYGLFRERLAGFSEKTKEYYEKYWRKAFGYEPVDDGAISESGLKELLDGKRGEEIFAENGGEVWPRLKLADRVKEILLVKESDAKDILGRVRDALGIYPAFDSVLTYFAHLYGEDMKQGGDSAREESRLTAEETAEMKRIIGTLQQKVQELVSAGMVEEADKLLQEIQKYTDMMG